MQTLDTYEGDKLHLSSRHVVYYSHGHPKQNVNQSILIN